ncbi:MAG TPA: outer membrane lipoprotein carrier protein LolA [Oligoflexus sp.]|uniref:LolA family protein n=1 Tax=Oligoflexus sp. TaxID=1971216 RepID=UPI002D7F6159|nr:outer membrane lipoprotein carrier protein LolA [Oligoflexus sp.]HET9237006.1 outer membrane lipoprotein carrier protein LolA [Oligoflexus sp.]
MIRYAFAMALSLTILPLAQAAEPKLQDKYAEIFSSVDHLAVDFSQTTYKKLRDRSTIRSGNAYFSKPGMFRWNFTDGKAGLEEYYFNGEKLTHYREKDRLVNHYNTNASLARELHEVVNLVLDPRALLSRYKVKEIKSQGGRTQAVLVPQQAGTTDVDSIFVKVSDVKKFVEEVQIFYIDGNYTQFAFKNPVNKTNDAKIFTFSRQGNFTVRHHG